MTKRGLLASMLSGLALAATAHAQVDQENLDDYGTGIIKDYANLRSTDTIEWVWIAPGVKLKEHRYEVKPVDNLTSYDDEDMEDMIDSGLARTMKRISERNAAGTLLQIAPAVYWAERGNANKLWVPYSGGHLAQAGVGLELVIIDDTGKEVAKFRHSGREGYQLRDAAEEVIDDLRKYISAH